MHNLTIITLGLILSFNSAYAQDECVLPEVINKQGCMVLQISQNSIEKRKSERAALESIQASLHEATELQNRLLDPENLHETELLEESLVNELALTFENKSGHTKFAVGSVGALIVSSFVVRNMAKSAQGATMLARIGNHLNPLKGRALKQVANSAFVISLGMSLYNVYQIKKTSDEVNSLEELIETLNKLKDQAQNLAKMTSELEEMQTCFWYKADLFMDQGFASLEGTKLICHE